MPDKNVFDRYLLALRKTKIDEKTEHTDRAALQTLLQAFADESSNPTMVQHEPKRVADKGAPDFKITSRGLILGYVENKTIGEHLDKVLKSNQITRYKSLSQNIILTDYLHFIWISKEGRAVLPCAHAPAAPVLRQDNRAAVYFASRAQAQAAARDRFLSAELKRRPATMRRPPRYGLHAGETSDFRGRWHGTGTRAEYGLFQIFRDQIFHELTLNEFADAFAQMLAYGLFLARLNSGSEPVTLHNAREHVPGSFSLIRELVDFLTDLRRTNTAMCGGLLKRCCPSSMR
jgi:hypothetical protein